MQVTLISTYEGGMQPLGIAGAAAHLAHAGHTVRAQDLTLEELDWAAVERSGLVTFSVPLFDSTAQAIEIAQEIRRRELSAKILFYGSYAMLNSEHVLSTAADAVIEGDWEHVLVDVAGRLERGEAFDDAPGISTTGKKALPTYLRTGRLVPDRSILPPLTSYGYAEAKARMKRDVVVGNVETARGCRFSCKYCSVFAAYKNKVVPFPVDVVLQDIDNVVAAGAQHICFIDADFLNAPKHALEIAQKMHEKHPELTFDFTTRCDLIIEDPSRIERLVSYGAQFLTSALEFPSDRVLEAVNKGFGVETIAAAIVVCRKAGITLNPTFLMFNPWISLEDLGTFSDFIAANGLEDDVEAIQFQTRLWLYKGSPLLQNVEVQNQITVENGFNYEWKHADPAVEQVFEGIRATMPQDTSTRCCLKC